MESSWAGKVYCSLERVLDRLQSTASTREVVASFVCWVGLRHVGLAIWPTGTTGALIEMAVSI